MMSSYINARDGEEALCLYWSKSSTKYIALADLRSGRNTAT